jgi:hypothetical protein
MDTCSSVESLGEGLEKEELGREGNLFAIVQLIRQRTVDKIK